MHQGIAANGDHLYPAFPYPWYTKVTREDALAIRAYLSTLDPVKTERRPNELDWPLNHRVVMVGWNDLFFKDGHVSARFEEVDGMESGRLSGRRIGPLRRVPHADKYFRRGEDERTPARRNIAGLVRAQLGRRSAIRAGKLERGGHRRIPQDRPQCQDRRLWADVGGRSRIRPRSSTMHDLKAIATYLKDMPAPARGDEARQARSETGREPEKQSTSTTAPPAISRMAKACRERFRRLRVTRGAGPRSDNGDSRDSRRCPRGRDGRSSDAIGYAVVQVEAVKRRGRGGGKLRAQRLGQCSARGFSCEVQSMRQVLDSAKK